MEKSNLFEMKHVTKCYRQNNIQIEALGGVDLYMKESEILGIVGESGSGKSTVAKLITHLETPSTGSIQFRGKDIGVFKGSKRIELYRDVQMVFQNPKASFNKRRTIGQSMKEHYKNLMGGEQALNVGELLKLVGLKESYQDRYPHELSGGECQRAAIARAISTKPKLLICDEVTSALDVSTQAQIMTLLCGLQTQFQMSILMISHDLALVSECCNRICVFYRGKVVEVGSALEVIQNPKEAYTRQLIESVMTI